MRNRGEVRKEKKRRRPLLVFGVWRLEFGVWPAAGAARIGNTARVSEGRCAGSNAQRQTSNTKIWIRPGKFPWLPTVEAG
jgi:hypothetical protein